MRILVLGAGGIGGNTAGGICTGGTGGNGGNALPDGTPGTTGATGANNP